MVCDLLLLGRASEQRNLVNNALKFTQPDGQVTLTAQIVQSSSWIEVSVQDTGVGMTAEVQQKLFQIDHHVTTTGTSNEKGSGLGLMMCQEMVQQHGGRIWVESKLGIGTTVRFTVPQEISKL